MMEIKEFLTFLWYLFLCCCLLYIISNIIMAMLKVFFCDVQFKLYRTWVKRLKAYKNDEKLEKVLDEIESKKKF